MTKQDQYLEALNQIGDWVTVAEWTNKVADMYPDLLNEAEVQASNQINDTTGLKELLSRVSSLVATGARSQNIEQNKSERPKKVRYITEEENQEIIHQEEAEDLAPINRQQIISTAEQALSAEEKYRLDEIMTISQIFSNHFKIKFEVDHAQALLNQESPGKHHPDNLQILSKEHNAIKNNKNWERFTIEEQIEYINKIISLQKIIAERRGIHIAEFVLDGLFDRLRHVFNT